MSRIDIQTLVLAFERRIEALEKNPPDKVPTSVIMNMLEKSIDEIIRDHFVYLVKKDVQKLIKNELKMMHNAFVSKTIESIITDEHFRQALTQKIKASVISNIK